ncbi:MAG: hypothetical protein ABI684_02375 [Nitrospirota bacterium]
MILFRMACCAAAIFAVTVSSVHADDICLGDEEENAAKAAIAAMSKAEKSGQPAELFVASRAIADDDCIDRFDKNAQARAKANVSKLGRDLAKASEAKGFLYSNEPVRADGRTSAFLYFEAIGDFNEANRVMLKAVHAKSDDLTLFETAWGVDRIRRGPRDPKTGEIHPHVSPLAYHEELRHIASTNGDQLMKVEETDANGLSGSAQDVMKASMGSLEKLKKASDWMKFLPNGNKSAKARAEQRGDTIMKRGDPMFTQSIAGRYYEFAGSSKAKEVQAKQEEMGRAMGKTGETVKGAITQKSEAEQKKFNDKKADLEKELGF